MEITDVQKRLDSIVSQLIELRDGLSSVSPAMPADAIRRMESNECLYCGKRITKSDETSRGCHSKCAQKIRRSIQKGQTTDAKAVEKGLWATAQTGGRPSTDNPFREVISEIEIDAEGGAVEAEIQKAVNRKKRGQKE